MWSFNLDTWELDACGLMALFFGVAAIVVSISESVFGTRPFDFTLVLFGVVCLFISWLALDVSVRRGYGR